MVRWLLFLLLIPTHSWSEGWGTIGELPAPCSVGQFMNGLSTGTISCALPAGGAPSGPAGGVLTGTFPNPGLVSGAVDLSTVTTQLNTKLSSGAVPTVLVDLSTVVTALAGKLSTTGQAASVAAGGLDLSTVTAQLNTKLSSGAIPTAFVDLSTVVTSLAGKLATNGVAASVASGGVDLSTVTTQLNTKLSSGAIPTAFVNLSTVAPQNGIITASSETITGTNFSVGGTTFVITNGRVGLSSGPTPNYTLEVNGAFSSTATLVKGLIAFSSVPVVYTCTGVSTATLTSGTTVMVFTVDSPIILKRVTTVVQAVGTGGAGDAISCATAGPAITASAGAASAKGTISNGVGSINVPIGNNVQCYYMGTSAPKPTLNLCLSYQMQ